MLRCKLRAEGRQEELSVPASAGGMRSAGWRRSSDGRHLKSGQERETSHRAREACLGDGRGQEKGAPMPRGAGT